MILHWPQATVGSVTSMTVAKDGSCAEAITLSDVNKCDRFQRCCLQGYVGAMQIVGNVIFKGEV